MIVAFDSEKFRGVSRVSQEPSQARLPRRCGTLFDAANEAPGYLRSLAGIDALAQILGCFVV
jgi:hypothetical protein